MASVKVLTGAAVALAAMAVAAGPDVAAPVLTGSVRSTHRIVLHDIETADRAADAVWLGITTTAQLKARQSSIRAGMVAAVGEMPVRAPLNAQTLRRHERDGYSIEEVMFESHPNVHVTALLFLPDEARFKAPYPGVIVTCGHSGNGKAFAGYQRTSLLLAKAGIAALVYDPFDQGERIQKHGFATVHGHNRIGVNATLLGWSMAGLRIWDSAADSTSRRAFPRPMRRGAWSWGRRASARRRFSRLRSTSASPRASRTRLVPSAYSS